MNPDGFIDDILAEPETLARCSAPVPGAACRWRRSAFERSS
jgi:hypothetical protein